MSWEDRDDSDYDDPGRGFGRPGGDWQGVRPSFDNFFSWSVFLGRISRISVRVHIFFLVYIVIELLKSVWRYAGTEDPVSLSPVLVAIMMASLFMMRVMMSSISMRGSCCRKMLLPVSSCNRSALI